MTNYEKLSDQIGKKHKPFIVYDVEATGVMNGNDNQITQIALASYSYNDKTKDYELQDEIFMLRSEKEIDEVINNLLVIEKAQAEDIEGTITQKLKEDYLYNLIRKEKDPDKKEQIKADKENIYGSVECLNYCNDPVRADKKRKELEDTPCLEVVLRKQGIELEAYRKSNEGLTSAEMQIGIMKFLDKYANSDTVFINNGTYYSKHYMEKANLSFLDKNNADNTIDLTQAERSMHGGGSKWTSDIDTFAKNYKNETGKEIKTFDALTKALCMGEMTAKAMDLSVSLVSENYLQQKVAESALSKDDEYVMSLSRASSLDWIPATTTDFINADYHFNSLEYVDFGNDRRYVDIDKMFEINENFEITLEGEKTPIKTWEELETKIKALNSEISNELLDKIHEKYEEVKEELKERIEEEKRRQAEEEKDIPIDTDIPLEEIVPKSKPESGEYIPINEPEEREYIPVEEEQQKETIPLGDGLGLSQMEMFEEKIKQYSELLDKKIALSNEVGTRVAQITEEVKKKYFSIANSVFALYDKLNDSKSNAEQHTAEAIGEIWDNLFDESVEERRFKLGEEGYCYIKNYDNSFNIDFRGAFSQTRCESNVEIYELSKKIDIVEAFENSIWEKINKQIDNYIDKAKTDIDRNSASLGETSKEIENTLKANPTNKQTERKGR